LVQNITSVGIGSDLIKPYENYLHTVNLKAEYIVPKNLDEEGDLYKINTQEGSEKEKALKAFPITEEERNIKLSGNQSLYDNDTLKQIINHKISQSILYNELDNPELQDLENYIKVFHDYGSVSGKIIYNVEDQEFVEDSANSIFTYQNLSLSLGYYKSKTTENSDREDLESYRVSTSYKITKDYRFSYYQNYNLIDNIKSREGVSFNIDDSCWNLDLRFENEIVPTSRLDSSAENGIDQKIIYATVLLKPLGGIKQKYKMQDEN
jgi:LPS-assembly protein